MSESLIIERQGPLLQLRLNRPAKKNALTLAMYDAMSEQIERAGADPAIRVILISGEGGNFTTGNDLEDFPDPTAEGPNPVFRFIGNVVTTTVPLVAAIEGTAAGIGATMLLYFDSAVAALDSRFLFPFINIALPPEAGSSLLLPQMMGYAPAAELLMRGKPFDAGKALDIGLVSRLAEPGNALSKALEIAAEFAAKPPAAMRETKRLLRGDTDIIMARIRQEEQILLRALDSPESREARTAFMQKRPADFSHFS